MRSVFNRSFSGLQINWEEDGEIEYLGRSALSGRSAHTAATCRRGRGLIHYLYPVKATFDSPVRLVLTYEEDPKGWDPKWGWEVCHGKLIIDFAEQNTQRPNHLSYWYRESDEIEPLIEGEDWVYIAGVPTTVEMIPRKRIQTSRLERPLQQALRNLLISEHGRCQVTETQCPTALEACHILPVELGGSDCVENSLLLRRDIHALFDAGLMYFRLADDHLVIEVDASVTDPAYRCFHGTSRSWTSCHPYFEVRENLVSRLAQGS